jgi:hypothetical protein
VPEILHPSFEFRSDFVLFGFAETVVGEEEDKKTKETKKTTSESRVRVICTQRSGPVERWGFSPIVRVGKREMILDLRFDSPSRLEHQWSRTDLSRFVKQPQCAEGLTLYSALKEAIHRHVDLMDGGAEIILAVWPVLSFCYPAFPAIPFLLFLGPKETGKTQALSVLQRLCRNGHRSKGTAASVGDLIQSRRATWLIDQANRLPEDLIDDLTDSYRAGAKRTVTNMDHRGQPYEFETYAPKVFAAHKNFNDDLIDRCIQIEMAPSVRDVEPILASDERLDHLRWHLYRYTAIRGTKLFGAPAFVGRVELGTHLGFKDREWELWWPFEVLFDWLQVPFKDREKARVFYRGSIQSTKAELPEKPRAVLEALQKMASSSNGPLIVNSNQLTFKSGSAGYIPPGELGKILKDFGLVKGKDRVTVEEKKVTQWTINREKLQILCDRWRIDGEED